MAILEREELLIGGQWQSSSNAWAEVICPSTEEVGGRVRTSMLKDIDLAVVAAKRAQDAGSWSGRSMQERAAVVRAAADLLDPQAAEIGHVITTEMGAPLALFQVVAATHYMRSLADAAEELVTRAARPGWLSWALVEREPVGVVGSLAPWNGPFHLAAQKTISALLAGCSVVFRPAEETPLDAFYLAEALIAAGLPKECSASFRVAATSASTSCGIPASTWSTSPAAPRPAGTSAQSADRS